MSDASQYAMPRHRKRPSDPDALPPGEQFDDLMRRYKGKLTPAQAERADAAIRTVAAETNDWDTTLAVARALAIGLDAWNSKRVAAVPKPAEAAAPVIPAVDGPAQGREQYAGWLTEKERVLVNWFRPPTAKRRGTALSIADAVNYHLWLKAEPHHKPRLWRGRGTVEALYGRTKWFRTQHVWSAIRTALDDPTSKLSKGLSAERWQQLSAVVDALL